MADEQTELLVMIRADVQDLKNKFDQVNVSSKDLTKSLGDQFSELGKLIAQVFAIAKIKQFVQEAVGEFAEMEDALNDLGNTVRSGGGDWAKLRDDTVAYINTAAGSTRFFDAQITKSLDLLAFKTGNLTTAMKLNEEAMKLARVRKMELSAAADIVGNAYLGNQRGVTQLAKALGVTGMAAQDAGRLFTILDQKTKNLGDDTKTVAFQLNQARKAWKDMQEEVGGLLAPMTMFWADLAQTYIPNTVKAIQSAGVVLSSLFIEMGILWDDFVELMKRVGIFLKDVWKNPAEAFKEFKRDTLADSEVMNQRIMENHKATNEELEKIWKETAKKKKQITTEGVADEARANQQRIKDEEITNQRITTIVGGLSSIYKQLAEDITKTALTSKNAWEDIGKVMVRAAVEAIATILDAFAESETAQALGALLTENYTKAGEHFLAAAGYGASAGVVRGLGAAYLAEGGIVTKPTNAVIGEGGEPEMVVPLSKAGKMGFGGGGLSVGKLQMTINSKDANSFASPSGQASTERALLSVLDRVKQKQGIRFAAGLG